MRRLLTSLLLCVAAAACSESTPSYPKRQPPEGFLQKSANITAGAKLFAEHCARCHGKPGEGRNVRAEFFQPPAPDFTNPAYRHKDPAYLFWPIARGKTAEPYRSRGSVMPAWGPHFSDTEIWQMVAYLQSRSVE